MFGFPPPEEHNPKHYWGARAIFTKWTTFNPPFKTMSQLDLVHDRMGSSGEDGEERDKFFHWVDRVALPELRKWVNGVSTSSREVFKMETPHYTMVASPNGSYGYVYIGAWTKETKEQKEEK